MFTMGDPLEFSGGDSSWGKKYFVSRNEIQLKAKYLLS